MNTSQTIINLKDFIDEDQYNAQWRWRIDELSLVFLDKDGNVVQTKGSGDEYAIQVGVTFPTLFNDTDPNKDTQTFLGHKWYCLCSYKAYGKITLRQGRKR